MKESTPSITSSILDVECVCILNDRFSCNYDICPDNYNYSRFTLKDKCRSEKWEVYLYGDMTIKVMGPDVQKTAEISAVAFYGVTGRLFWAVYTGTRPGLTLAIRAGKGWRGRRELAPRCSATRIRCITRTRLDRHAVTLIIGTTNIRLHRPRQARCVDRRNTGGASRALAPANMSTKSTASGLHPQFQCPRRPIGTCHPPGAPCISPP